MSAMRLSKMYFDLSAGLQIEKGSSFSWCDEKSFGLRVKSASIVTSARFVDTLAL